ncbi:MAG: glycoside hydrolase family 3 C-terminal domain-containing protein [Thermoanaerobaculia bacterium]|nr:glycoside hydrolase family 3 C-terminal domain-containing protein [Thermoanaerobaculia bacterium]
MRVCRFLIPGVLLAGAGLSAQTPEKEAALLQRVEELVSQLTLEEKASLTSGRDAWSTQPIDRLGIPFIWLADGPHGLRRAPTTDTWGYGDQAPATCFPTASSLSATWDTDLVEEVGRALGQEAQALGVNVLLGPGVNIKRSPLGGRNFEYFSEDPLLAGELAAAYVNGVQSQGVGTSVKHYVANNVETQRMYANSDVDDRTLNEIYMTPFEIAVRKAQPWTVMACYNRVQGVYGTQSPMMLSEKLKEEWGFEGIVVSDWDAVIDRVEGIKAGLHLEMPGKVPYLTDRMIVDAVNDGELDEARLDELVREILRIVLMGTASAEESADQNLEQHHALARRVSSEGITLLKNDGGVLPLSSAKYERVAVIGEFAAHPRFQGNGSSEVKPARLDKFLDVVQAEHGADFEIAYARGYDLADDTDLSRIEEARDLAAASDVALIFAGLPQHYESEGVDRTHIDIPPSHHALISEVARVQKRSVVVLTNGSAIAMPWVEEVPAIVEGWLGGQAGAGATADVLFGRVNPSGKLAETFPKRLEDTPAFLNFPGENGNVIYGERIFVGYRWYDKRSIEPLFPFGHGLSYTTFEYSDLRLSAPAVTDREELTVSATITNVGEMAGKEVVQLYVSDLESSLQRPVRELKGFAKVSLQPGESKPVTLTLAARDFAFYDPRQKDWVAESGEFTVALAASSRDIRLSETFRFTSTRRLHYKFDEYTFFRELWENEDTKPLLIELMPGWIGSQAPEGQPPEAAEIHGFLQDQPIVKFPYFTAGEVTREEIAAFLERCNALTYTP